MPFGVVSRVRLGMGVLDFGGDRRMGGGRLAVSGVVSGIVWHFRPILYNGDIQIDTLTY